MVPLLNLLGIGSRKDNDEEKRPLRRTLSERIPAVSEIVRLNILNTVTPSSARTKDRNFCPGFSSLWLIGLSRKVYACQGDKNITYWVNPVPGVAVQYLKNIKKADLPEQCYMIKIEILKTEKPVTDGNYFVVTMDGTSIQAPFLDDLRKNLNNIAARADDVARRVEKPVDRSLLLWLQIFGNPRKFHL